MQKGHRGEYDHAVRMAGGLVRSISPTTIIPRINGSDHLGLLWPWPPRVVVAVITSDCCCGRVQWVEVETLAELKAAVGPKTALLYALGVAEHLHEVSRSRRRDCHFC